MDNLRRAWQAIGGSDVATPSAEPWYRRPDVWLLVGTVVLPFGWVLAVGRAAWVYAAARRRSEP